MKKLLCFVGAIAYSAVISYILFLIIALIDKWVLGFSWLGFILFSSLGLSIVLGCSYGLAMFISIPMNKMIKICPAAKWIPLLTYVVNGIYYCIVPWQGGPHNYTLLTTLLALTCSVVSISLFAGAIVGLFNSLDD